MVSKDLSQGLITTSQVTTKAQSYFNGLYTDAEAPLVTFNATYTPGSGNTSSTIQITGSGNITTVFMKIAGFPTMNSISPRPQPGAPVCSVSPLCSTIPDR